MTATFAALRHSDFRLLWLGLLTSGVGSGMQTLAVGWLIVEIAQREGSPHLVAFYIGLVGLARGLPAFSVGLLAGVMADRLDRRLLLMVTRLGGAVVALLFAALVVTDAVTIQWVMVLTVVQAIDHSFDTPTRSALVPRLVPARDLLSASGLILSTMNLSQIIGPLIAGVTIATAGVGWAFGTAAIGHVLAVVALLIMPATPAAAPRRHPNVAAALGQGLAFVFHDRALRLVVGSSLIVAFFARPLGQFMPAVAHDSLHVGAIELSWLLASAGIGGLIGSLTGASLGNVRSPRRMLAWSIVAWGVSITAFASQTTLLPALLLAALPSASQLLFATIAYAQLQTGSPDELRGRVLSVFAATNGAGGVAALGQLALGSAGSAIGIGLTLAISGGIVAVAGLYVLLRISALHDPSPARIDGPPETAVT